MATRPSRPRPCATDKPKPMDEVWPWLASLPPPTAGGLDAPPPWSLPLASSPDGASIVLQANAGTNTGGDPSRVATSVSVAINGAGGAARALWTSDAFTESSSPIPLRLQLLAQLVNEVLELSPYAPCLGASAVNLAGGGDDASSDAAMVDVEVLYAAVAAPGTDASPSGAAAFFSLALLLRIFWLCALDAPADAGYLFFRDLGAAIERALGESQPALAVFLRFVGPDVEERLMRSLGYMLAKWCLLREMQAAPQEVPPRRRAFPAACVSYATEAHGLLVLRGYAPVLAMARVTGAAAAAASTSIAASPHEAPEESALWYGLAHQQLEAVAQLEYTVRARGDRRFLAVSVRVDNLRVRVARLSFRKDDDADADAGDGDDVAMDGERHFPSRIRLWVGPRLGASYATWPSLGRSTGNPERDVETTRTVKGAFFATKLGAAPGMKAKARSSARTRSRSWRWEQEAEGSAGVFEGVLCDPVSGTEVSAWRPGVGGGGGGGGTSDPRNGMRRRYGGHGRAFSEMRGLVVAGDELPEEVTWRVGREEKGRTLRWRIGLKVWVSYMPNEVRTRHFETRCVEWAHEVELPLIAINGDES